MMAEASFIDVFRAIWPVFVFLLTGIFGVIYWLFKVQRRHTEICLTVQAHKQILNHDKLMEWGRADEARKGKVAQLRKDLDELKATAKEDRDKLSKAHERLWESIEDLRKFQARLNGKARRSP